MQLESKPVVNLQEIISAKELVKSVYIDERIAQYIADIVFANRYPEKYKLSEIKNYISFGGSPRASINLALAGRACAFIKRRGYVVPEDIREIVFDVLRHRIGLTYEAEAQGVKADELITEILNKVEVP
jgi:MoxR-like ATPase